MRCLVVLVVRAAMPAASRTDYAHVAPDVSRESGILEIVPIDPRGALISGLISVTARRVERGQLMARNEIAPKSTLPYARYEITVTVPGFHLGRRTVEVDSRYQVAIVPLAAGFSHEEDGVYVRRPLPERSRRQGCIWVRLIPLLTDIGTQATRATGAGIYAFEHVQPGPYMLMTHGSDGVCDTVQLDVQPAGYSKRTSTSPRQPYPPLPCGPS